MDERDVRLVKAISDLGTSPEAFFTVGETDFVVIAQLSSSDTVERLISEFEAIDGVERTNSTSRSGPSATSHARRRRTNSTR